MTAGFVAAGATVLGVDREPAYLEVATGRGLPGVELVLGDLSSCASEQPFDHVVLANVIHEVADPIGVLVAAAEALAPAGLLHLSLQNPSSLHRLVGIATGAMAALHEVSERGSRFGTNRIFDSMELRGLGARAGLRDIHHEGIMIKPFPNDVLGSLDDETLRGFVAAGRLVPEFAAMNYLIFRRT